MVSSPTPLRNWHETDDGWEYRQGTDCVGGVLVTDYGTICFSGPLGRGTAESLGGAKQVVEDMFDPQSAYSQMVKAAQSQLQR